MAKRSVFCITPTRASADLILHDLKVDGFPSTGVAVLFVQQRAGDSESAASSTDIRGVMAWVDGIGVVEVAGAPPLIVGGLLARSFTKGTRGGISGGLEHFGVPDTEAERYATRIMEGQFLISVHGDNPEAGSRARDIFAAGGATGIFTMMEITQPKRPSILSSYRTARVA